MFPIIEVRWENVNGTIHRTRVTPGDATSATEYIHRTRGEAVQRIICSAVERKPPQSTVCPHCKELH